MKKIDISKIREVYPSYEAGQTVSPVVLIESMIIMQSQEYNLVFEMSEALKEVDSLKFQLDKKKKEIESFLERNCIDLISEDSIPKEFRKNQDLTDYYIKYGSDKSSNYETLVKESFEIEEKLVEAKSMHKKYDSLTNVVHGAINTAIQVLSYLKHEEKISNVTRNI